MRVFEICSRCRFAIGAPAPLARVPVLSVSRCAASRRVAARMPLERLLRESLSGMPIFLSDFFSEQGVLVEFVSHAEQRDTLMAHFILGNPTDAALRTVAALRLVCDLQARHANPTARTLPVVVNLLIRGLPAEELRPELRSLRRDRGIVFATLAHGAVRPRAGGVPEARRWMRTLHALTAPHTPFGHLTLPPCRAPVPAAIRRVVVTHNLLVSIETRRGEQGGSVVEEV